MELGIQPACRSFLATGEGPARLKKVRRLPGACGQCDRTAAPLPEPLHVVCQAPDYDEAMILSGWRGAGRIVLAPGAAGEGSCHLGGTATEASVPVDAESLAGIILTLQEKGCHNILLHSPGRMASLLVPALLKVAEQGLRIPVAYHCTGQECLEFLRMLDGLVDIYLCDAYGGVFGPQLKGVGRCNAYSLAIQEMHRQVGELAFDDQGLARRGIVIRHPVLPRGLACTKHLLEFLARDVSPRTYLMLTKGVVLGESDERSYQTSLRLAKRLNLLRSDAHWSMARSGMAGSARPFSRSSGSRVRSV